MSERERRKCLEVLGLAHSSSEDDIKKAYRRLALQYHPDKNTEDGAKEQFQEISYAYKYLIEGPEAAGAEEEDEGIPLEVLLRLFPWLFAGGRFFHPGFHGFHPAFQHFDNPFFPGFYDDMYIDSEDEDSYDEDFFYNQSEPKPKSTYVPGPSKEEKRKEKKKKAKERRKAAKMSKPQAAPKPKKETQPAQQTSNTSATNNTATMNPKSSGTASYSDDINMPDLKEKSSPRPTADTVKLQAGSHDSSSTSIGPASNNTQSKKSKKKLKEEQKKREKEMESIANEFKKKQQQQAEKEARREAAKQERKGREATLQTQEADDSIADTDSVITGNDDSESVRTDQDIEDEAARAQVIDDEEDTEDEEEEEVDYDDVDDADLEVDGKEAVPKADKTKNKMHGRSTSNQKSGSVNSSASRPVPDGGHQTRQGQKTQYKDYRSSSRGAEASGTSVSSDRNSQTSKKMKRNGRQKEAKWEDWNDLDAGNSPPYEGLMPQSEAEEMRMFHEAILMSEREAKQHGKKETNKNKRSSPSMTRCDELSFIDDVSCSDKGVIPQSQEEERIMLETALRESQITAHWHGNIDTLDDVSDGEDGAALSGESSFSGASAGTVGDWHKSIGNNSSFLKQNKDNVKSRSQLEAGKINLSNGDIKLGGLGSGSNGFSNPTDTGVKGSQRGRVNSKNDFLLNGSSENQFDRTVGGKVKRPSGKTKADGKKKGDNSWEFGGSGSSKTVFKTDNAEGLEFGLDADMTFVNGSDSCDTVYQSESKGSIQHNMSKAYNIGAPSAAQKSQNMSAKQTGSGNKEDIQSQIRSHILAQLKHPKGSASTGLPNESKKKSPHQSSSVPASKESQYGSSHAASNGNVSSAQNFHSVINDMDDIDDVDTFGESSAPTFSLPAEPTSSFDLNIPAALCNKEKIKSYYQRKK